MKLSAPYESSVEPVTDSGDDHSDLDPLIDALVDELARVRQELEGYLRRS